MNTVFIIYNFIGLVYEKYYRSYSRIHINADFSVKSQPIIIVMKFYEHYFLAMGRLPIFHFANIV